MIVHLARYPHRWTWPEGFMRPAKCRDCGLRGDDPQKRSTIPTSTECPARLKVYEA